AFSGLNLYVEIGRGSDYAWSATSAVHDITDTFAVPLCDADHYVYHGQCLAMEKLVKHNTWTPTTADPTPAGSYDLVSWRTKYGLVMWRATVAGAPTAFVVLRSTYRHEVDSAVGFQ